MDEPPDRNQAARKDRRLFYVALAAFFAWVAFLGALAVFSGRSPSPNSPAIERR
jgi:hypothetical protein